MCKCKILSKILNGATFSEINFIEMDKIETRAVSFYLKYFEQKTKAIRKDIQNTYECEKTDQFTEYNQKHL